jgi:hypothetical protein
MKNSRLINVTLYIAFLLLSFAGLARADSTTAIVGLGISFAFDPFDPAVPFPKRPLWQRGVLILQLAVLLGVIAREFVNRLV